jgi:hypothetical protein
MFIETFIFFMILIYFLKMMRIILKEQKIVHDFDISGINSSICSFSSFDRNQCEKVFKSHFLIISVPFSFSFT